MIFNESLNNLKLSMTNGNLAQANSWLNSSSHPNRYQKSHNNKLKSRIRIVVYLLAARFSTYCGYLQAD